MENPIKMDDLGVPLFLETSICIVYLYSMRFFVFQSRLPNNSSQFFWNKKQNYSPAPQNKDVGYLSLIEDDKKKQFVRKVVAL